ncbi:hypothetical protein D3C76_1495260 [compost metagenome]
MQIRDICIGSGCADALHMDMQHLSSFLSFSGQIRKKVKSDLQWNPVQLKFECDFGEA